MLFWKTISTPYYASKNYLRKWIFNIIFDLYFNLCKLACQGNIYKMIHRKERCITKNVSKNKNSKYCFMQYFFRVSKELIENPNFYFALCKKVLLLKFIRFYGKSYFILKTCFWLSYFDTLNFRKNYKVVWISLEPKCKR